jgi:DNA-binding response OmpR family regulator
MSLNTQARQCHINGKEVALQPKEFAVLEFLMRHKPEVFSNDALIERVWKADTTATEDAIRTCVMRLRKKLNDADPGTEWIETVPRVGYRFKC